MTNETTKTTAVQGLAGEIIHALLADEKDGGYDLTAGLFGPAFSALVRRWAWVGYDVHDALLPGDMGFKSLAKDGPVGAALQWLKSALECKSFAWDGDQKECAEGALLCANDWLTRLGPVPEQHPDDAAVDVLAALMKAKLAKQREKGYGGWETPSCSQQHLSDLLRKHVDKGDPVDVANFCAFLVARGEGIVSNPQSVTSILLRVVPGLDGMGHEVYAKTAKDVEDVLTELGQELEDWRLGIKTLEKDDYKTWYEEAMVASNEAGFVGMSAADTIRALSATQAKI